MAELRTERKEQIVRADEKRVVSRDNLFKGMHLQSEAPTAKRIRHCV